MDAAKKKFNIRRSIERLLLPALIARGFEEATGDVRDLGLPYGRFLRRGAGGMEIVEIQFDKNNLSHFRLSVAVATGENAMRVNMPSAPWFKIPAAIEDQHAGHVLPHYYLTRWGLPFPIWFGVRKRARDGITEGEFDAAVMKAVAQLPQIERLFSSGKSSWRMEEMPERSYRRVISLGAGILLFLIPLFAVLWLVGFLIRLP